MFLERNLNQMTNDWGRQSKRRENITQPEDISLQETAENKEAVKQSRSSS